MKIIWILISLILFVSCGQSMSDSARDKASVAVTINNSRSVRSDATKTYAQIVKYIVSVKTPDSENPVVSEFQGDAASGVVENVPIGEDNKVYVDAINGDGQAIRQGEKFDVDIGAGENSVAVELEAVPIFTNVKNGSVVENSRLIFKIFSDANHPLALQDESSVMEPLVDLNTDKSELYCDASTGLGLFRPGVSDSGKHKFFVQDLVTGRASSVELVLIDGIKRRPAPFVSGVSAGSRNVSKISN